MMHPLVPVYHYDLGYHIRTRELCRIPKGRIPQGCVKILKFKSSATGFKEFIPYDKNGALRVEFWSFVRWQDLEQYG